MPRAGGLLQPCQPFAKQGFIGLLQGKQQEGLAAEAGHVAANREGHGHLPRGRLTEHSLYPLGYKKRVFGYIIP